MPNAWISFVKDYAAKNNISYGCAMGKQELKDLYKNRNSSKADDVVVPDGVPDTVTVRKKRGRSAKVEGGAIPPPPSRQIAESTDAKIDGMGLYGGCVGCPHCKGYGVVKQLFKTKQ